MNSQLWLYCIWAACYWTYAFQPFFTRWLPRNTCPAAVWSICLKWESVRWIFMTCVWRPGCKSDQADEARRTVVQRPSACFTLHHRLQAWIFSSENQTVTWTASLLNDNMNCLRQHSINIKVHVSPSPSIQWLHLLADWQWMAWMFHQWSLFPSVCKSRVTVITWCHCISNPHTGPTSQLCVPPLYRVYELTQFGRTWRNTP